jgi:hypothetical protein
LPFPLPQSWNLPKQVLFVMYAVYAVFVCLSVCLRVWIKIFQLSLKVIFMWDNKRKSRLLLVSLASRFGKLCWARWRWRWWWQFSRKQKRQLIFQSLFASTSCLVLKTNDPSWPEKNEEDDNKKKERGIHCKQE